MSSDVTLSSLIEQFLLQVSQRYSQPTVAAYSQALHIFGQHLHHHYKLRQSMLRLSNLEMGWGSTFMEWLQDTRSVETEHLYMRAIHQFYEYVSQLSGQSLDIEELSRYID